MNDYKITVTVVEGYGVDMEGLKADYVAEGDMTAEEFDAMFGEFEIHTLKEYMDFIEKISDFTFGEYKIYNGGTYFALFE